MPKFDQNIDNSRDRKEGMYEEILGIHITVTHKEKVLRQVQEYVAQRRKFSIVTPNPEIVLKASEDVSYRNILNKADIAIPDGIGLKLASELLMVRAPGGKLVKAAYLLFQAFRIWLTFLLGFGTNQSRINVVRGRELFLDLCLLANRKGWRVYLLGGEHDEAQKTQLQLESTSKAVKVRSNPGPRLNNFGDPVSKADQSIETQVLKEIAGFKPHLLFIAFSAPKQERWMMRHLKDLPVGGAMVVGGAFNYTSGRSKLPPAWLASRGLEWLWRGVTEPWRLGRILRAVVAFPYKVFLYKLRS